MSAKRLKIASVHNGKRPSPSLRSNNTPITTERERLDSRIQSSSDPRPFWQDFPLLQLDAALILHGIQHRTRLFPLSVVYDVIRKLPQGAKTNDSLAAKLQSLSEAERHLLAFTCVACPVLYQLKNVKPPIANTAPQEDEDLYWCLEQLPFSGSRSQEFQRLMRPEKHYDECSFDRVLKVIHSFRKANDKKPDDSHVRNPVPASVPVESLLTTHGDTVEDRVRARAELKRKREEAEREVASKECQKDASLDREWLVRVADALWSHTSDILQRQSIKHYEKQNSTTRACVITAKDAIALLRKSMMLNKAYHNHNQLVVHHGEKASKHAIMKAIRQLHDLVPEWIIINDPDDITDGISQNATIWIKPIEYKGVRAEITGRHPCGIKRKEKVPLSTLHEDSCETPTPVQNVQNNRSARVEEGNIEPTHAYINAACSTPGDRTSEPRVVTAETILPSQPAQSKSLDMEDVKRIALGNTDLSPRSEVAKIPKYISRKRSLRINPNLIFCDADYDGGQILAPTLLEAPRGLRGLFNRMNEGKRI